MLVSGPIVSSVTSPGYLRTIWRIISAAGVATGLVVGSGKTAPPNPFSPCAYVAVTRRRSSGARAPAATGISVRPAISTMRNAFGSVRSSGTFPATGVMASIFSSGDRIASKSARASSTPGSVSMITRAGPRTVPAPVFPSDCPCSDGLPATVLAPLAPRAKPLVAKTAAEDVTNCRRVMGKISCFVFTSLAP